MKSFSRFVGLLTGALFATLAIAFTASASPQPEPTPMQAQPAQVVMFKSAAVAANGTDTHPAIVTRSWNANDIQPGYTGSGRLGMINVSVIPDAGHHVVPFTSVTLYATEADGDAAVAAMTPAGYEPRPHFAFYPEGTFPAAAAAPSDAGTHSVVVDSHIVAGVVTSSGIVTEAPDEAEQLAS